MSNWDKRYTEQVKLLVEILPMLAREPRLRSRAVPRSTCLSMICPDYRSTST